MEPQMTYRPPTAEVPPAPVLSGWNVHPLALGAAFLVTFFAGLAGLALALTIWFLMLAVLLIPAAGVVFMVIVAHQQPGSLNPGYAVAGLGLLEVGMFYWWIDVGGGGLDDLALLWPALVPGVVTLLVAAWMLVATTPRYVTATPLAGPISSYGASPAPTGR